MGNPILKIKDKYLIWSTVVDAPITYLMTLEQLKEEVRYKYGQEGIDELPERLKRVELKGTSSMLDKDLEDAILCNRAGANESELTIEEIYEEFNQLGE